MRNRFTHWLATWAPLFLFVVASPVSGQCELDKLTASDGATEDFFGNSVTVSEEVAVVGASSAALGGAAYIFRKNGGNDWVEEIRLSGRGSDPDDAFGTSVSVSGGVAVVGAPGDDDACGGCPALDPACCDSGAVFVFRFEGGSWAEEQKLTASDSAAIDRFGDAVSVSENVIAVLGAGAAYVYRYDGSQWKEEQKLIPSDGALGTAISVSVGVIVLGAGVDSPLGVVNAGSAYVFRFNGVQWIEEQKLTASDLDAGDHFGLESVSISENLLVVGTATGEFGQGAAYVYRHDGVKWVEEQKLVTSAGTEGDLFGLFVSVLNDTIAVGAFADDEFAPLSGSAYVYQYNGSSWVEEERLTPNPAVLAQQFGGSVVVGRGEILVGSPGDSDLGFLSGSVFVFAYPGAGCGEGDFVRGDSDADGVLNALVDGLFLLAFQFVPGSRTPPCSDAADADDDGTVNGLADALYTLNYVFLPGSSPPPSPGPTSCGADPTQDSLLCDSHPCP